MKNKASLVCTHPMTLVSVIAPALFLLHRELFLGAFLIYCQLDDCPGGVAVVVLQLFL